MKGKQAVYSARLPSSKTEQVTWLSDANELRWEDPGERDLDARFEVKALDEAVAALVVRLRLRGSCDCGHSKDGAVGWDLEVEQTVSGHVSHWRCADSKRCNQGRIQKESRHMIMPIRIDGGSGGGE